MDLENKIEAQRKRMEQEKNKLDMLMKRQRWSRGKQITTERLWWVQTLKHSLMSRGDTARSRPDGLCRWHLPQERSRTA